MDRKGFCILPFNTLYVENDRVRLCCESEERTNHHLDNEIGIMDLWNNDFYQSIRKSMLDGNLPDSCRICKLTEIAGEESKRQWENSRIKNIDHFTDIVNNGPNNFDVRPSNKCNLECVMCNGAVSSAITKRVREYNDPNLPIRVENDWDQSIHITEYVKKNAENVSQLKFAGGEPFLMPEVYDLLESLSKSGHAEHIELTILTNGTVIRERWFEDHIMKFKKVKINVSIDGTGSVLEYVRWPTNWNKIRSNILFLKKFETTSAKFRISLAPVLHLLNALNIPDLIKFAGSNDIDIALGVVYQTSNETWLSTSLLKKELKTKVVSDFQNVLNEYPDMSFKLGREFIYNLQDEDYNLDQKQLDYLNRVVKYWDSHKPIKFLNEFPHLDYLITDK